MLSQITGVRVPAGEVRSEQSPTFKHGISNGEEKQTKKTPVLGLLEAQASRVAGVEGGRGVAGDEMQAEGQLTQDLVVQVKTQTLFEI